MIPRAKIQLRAASKTYLQSGTEPVDALRSLDISIADGEIYSLLGPSGCGKSTALSLIAGFEPPTTGEILMDDEPVTRPGPERAVVFQQPTLFPWLDVLGNIMLGLDLAGIERSQARERALRYVDEMGLIGFEKRYPYELSGGMQQRVALARAWVNTPSVLLLDEPFGALDAQTRLAMQELLLELWGHHKTTILFITHDVDEAIFLSDRIGVMTKRPGLLKDEVPVNIARPRTVATTMSPEFIKVKKKIFSCLGEQRKST